MNGLINGTVNQKPKLLIKIEKEGFPSFFNVIIINSVNKNLKKMGRTGDIRLDNCKFYVIMVVRIIYFYFYPENKKGGFSSLILFL
jgi:hypothetical protein